MTADEFRSMALSLPEVSEAAHMHHPDFRVGDKIFATLGYPDEGWGMVKLTPEQQALYVQAEPGVFVPCKGAWGRRGSTSVCLRIVEAATLHNALVAAWRNTAPAQLVQEFGVS
jgi:hypothetical protein